MVKTTELSVEEDLHTSKAETHENDAGRTTEECQEEMIAKAAYFKAKQRDFEPGHEIDDWLAAEADIYGLAY